MKQEKKVAESHFQSILRSFDALLNFCFTASETMHNYFVQTWNIGFSSRVAQRLKT